MTDDPRLYNSVAPLANVARLLTLVDRCQTRAHGLPGMGTFYGPSGWGKTTAGIYATNKFNACHVEALPFGGTKTLLTMIVTELGLRPARAIPDLFGQAAEELARTGRPLLLDEADHLLSDKLIETVRRLHDVTGVPVILIGEELLPQKLRKWERVDNRMLVRVGAEPASLEDVGHLVPIYAPGLEIDADLRAALLTASRQSIRRVATNLANLCEFARARGLARVTRADWGKGAFTTGEAPPPRRIVA
ncbi:AAA family ATPase [Paracoccaceae bacterium Fryx2]|nr:AAA family ATPase [Paracoccaceae bacterium Fryx2]